MKPYCSPTPLSVCADTTACTPPHTPCPRSFTNVVQDILGAPVEVDDFVVAGTSAQSLYGTCEAFFKEGMEPEELFRAASRCLLSALERDCLSGYGAVVHIITDEGIETRELTTRMD